MIVLCMNIVGAILLVVQQQHTPEHQDEQHNHTAPRSYRATVCGLLLAHQRGSLLCHCGMGRGVDAGGYLLDFGTGEFWVERQGEDTLRLLLSVR